MSLLWIRASADVETTQAEEALRESQQLLQQVLATMPVGVTVTDLEGNVVLANAASKRIWGGVVIVSGRERRARSKGFWHDSGNRIDAAEWASVRALSQGRTILNELIDIETYQGERKTIHNSAAPIRNAEGLIVGAVIVNEDVTERVRAEEALRQSADRLHNLSRRLLEVQEEERRHLARELHDEFGQLLATITLHLHAARRLAAGAAKSTLDESMALLQRAGEQVRSLALDLRPAMLETVGLDATLPVACRTAPAKNRHCRQCRGPRERRIGRRSDCLLPCGARGVDQRRAACAGAARMDRAQTDGPRDGAGDTR